MLNRRFERPEITFNQRGKIAGSARLQTNHLRFNPDLLSDNFDTFMSDVVPHEVCHLLVFNLYGKVKPHGVEWQNLMTRLYGLQPKTRHTMDVSKVEGKTFTYHCACGPVPLSIRRHNKVARKQQQYVCRRCKQPLKFSGKSD